jgi:two-component system response regulator HydG
MERHETILVVDDDPEVRRALTLVLEDHGWKVAPVPDATTARETLRRQAIDLVILDLTLPDTSGLDFLEDVRRSGLQCPVIVVTGSTGLDPAIRSIALGAFDYISKPFSPNYLLKSVEHALTPIPH